MESAMDWNKYKHASDDEKVQMLKDGAEQGDALCQFGYGNYLASIDPAETEWLKASAMQGFTVAQHALGLKKTGFESRLWLQRSADGGCTASWFALGMLYEYGRNDDFFNKDPLSAALCYKNAIENDYDENGLKGTLGPLYSDFIWENLVLDGAVCVAAAQYRLGMLYLERRDIAHAVDTGLGWLTKAADNGHAEATYALGYIYANGSYGVERDIAKASQLIESYKNQPDKLDPKAQERLRYALSLCLDTKGGLPK
ncbi:MAG: sel1 repeat family protein [Bacteroidales bacterium]|nr:sel1 repeat family protein [Bacteroidales bacterium]